MRAAEIVKEMAELRLNDFVFPGMKPVRPLSDMALLTLLRELRPGITTHGFRSTFKDWANEKTNFPDFLSRRHWRTFRQTRSAERMHEATCYNSAGL